MKSEGKNTKIAPLVAKILASRGIKTATAQRDFLDPDYDKMKHDPFRLWDMKKAVTRIKKALKNNEKITIYGDYDIDGMTATVVLWESLRKFGLEVETYTPDRFSEGYGLNVDAVEKLAADGTKLIITVDNGTLSFDEIKRAKELGVDVIVTDHHQPLDELPSAVAVLNPKRADNQYPFNDLAGCGVAFKLIQALQTELDGLPDGQEKWLLDLVAMGTVCDAVGLIDENRANVKWGLEVLKKTRRPGLKALLSVACVELKNVDARTLGFVLGPRLNAAGRLETAEMALELLKTDNNARALELAEKLDDLNRERRQVQDEIFIAASTQIIETDPVAIAVGDDWHEGVIGIVAAKILEKFERPAFVLSRGAEFTKGSGRSFGEFSCAAALHHTAEIIEKGGGHLAAGGLTLRSEKINEWRAAIQDYYGSLNLKNQTEFLMPKSDVVLENFADLTPELLDEIKQLEPFGYGNRTPVFEFSNVLILGRRIMGAGQNHVRYTFADSEGQKFTAVAFDAIDKFTLEPFDLDAHSQHARVMVELMANEWNGVTRVEGRLLGMNLAESNY
ncbi:single-stranded-DNA-specific exonuclease RecJ [Candidatus Saccharibacteria bacterium]|nr:single-stranded-DNA-specific exonuclease RecJ [Candidatus Saccharibacteria bacterium]